MLRKLTIAALVVLATFPISDVGSAGSAKYTPLA